MFCKIFALIFTLQTSLFVQRVESGDYDENGEMSFDEQLKMEMFTTMSSTLQDTWSKTPSDQNIQFFPITKAIGANMVQIQMFYRSNYLSLRVPKEEYLNKTFTFANIIDKIAQSSSAKFKVRNAIFYDPRYANKEYVNDLQKYFHSEVFGMFLDPNNEESFTYSLNEWYSAYTKGMEPKKEKIYTPGIHMFHAKALYFLACWNTAKSVGSFEIMSTSSAKRGRRRPRDESSLNILPIRSQFTDGNYVETFNARETIGYFNNTKLEYEAIRLPYHNGEFAMVIILPYENRSLELVTKFTNDDYSLLFQRLNISHEYIDYAIPSINLQKVLINQNGTSINGEKEELPKCKCASEQKYNGTTNSLYKKFYVNRPFGVLIYHEDTKYVLWQALVKNPKAASYVPPLFMNHVNAVGIVSERKPVTEK